jgi:putative cardiolipin synthase
VPASPLRPRAGLLAAAVLLGGCATLPLDTRREASHAYADSERSTLWRLWEPELARHPALSGFRLLVDGVDAFTALENLADRAEHTLDVQYYMVHTDDSGKLLIDRLLAAADRGVRVRVLIDDLYALDSDRDVARLDHHPNMEVRIFNPWHWRNNPVAVGVESLLDVGRINHRMHNKLFVADNAAMVMGGRNWGDEYFQLDRKLDFRDLDVLAVGPIVHDASRVFDEFWNSKWAVPISGRTDLSPSNRALQQMRDALDRNRAAMADSAYGRAVRDSPLGAAIRDGTLALEFARARLVADPPEKVRGNGHRLRSSFLFARFQEVMPRATRQLLISSPYFVPSHAGLKFLRAAASQGVDVRVLTNSYLANDVPAVHSGYAPYRNDLLRDRIRLFELKRDAPPAARDSRLAQSLGSTNASLHTKAIVVDRSALFIGSLNIDPRSILRNTEDGLVIESPALAEQAARLLLRAMAPDASYEVKLAPGSRFRLLWETEENGERVVLEREPGMRPWVRFKLWVLRLLPFESQI